jgi:signal transduction histidine kinase
MTDQFNTIFFRVKQLTGLGVHEGLSYREKREVVALNSVNLGIIVMLAVMIFINIIGEKYFAAMVEVITIIFGCLPVFYFHSKRQYTVARIILFAYAIISCMLIALSAAQNHRKVNTEYVFFGLSLTAVLYYRGWKKNVAFVVIMLLYFSVRGYKFFYWQEKSSDDFVFECINASVVFYIVYLVSNLYKSYFDFYERQITSQNKELSELNEQKSKLFSIIAHDLRSPLGNVNQILALAAEGKLSKAELDELLEKLSKNASYTSELLDNLLSWASSQLKGAKIKREIFELNYIVQHKILLYHQQAKQKGVTVSNMIQEPVMVFADKNMIEVVLRNLISNAIKFCKKGDRIIITAVKENNQVKVCVADSGVGMNEEDFTTVFENINFTKPGTANEKGTGLGLPLCKDFVEKNNGNIRIESEPGKGTNVLFTLPLK